jgi:hypothetical protein
MDFLTHLWFAVLQHLAIDPMGTPNPTYDPAQSFTFL